MSKTQNLSIQMNYAFPDDEPGAWIDFNEIHKLKLKRR